MSKETTAQNPDNGDQAVGAELLDPQLAARALETSGIGLWIWDIEAGTVRYSRHFKELLGFTPEEFPDTITAFFDRMPPDDRVAVSNAIRQHLEHRLPYDVEFRMSTRAGGYRWFRARGQATWSHTGVALQMSGTNVDVTDLRTQEQALRRSEARLRRAQRVARVGSWELDLITRQTVWSDEVYRILGFDKADGPRSFAEYRARIPTAEQPMVDAALERVIAAGEPYAFDHTLRRPDGEIRHVHATGEPVRAANGRIERVTGTFVDITERKRQEAETQQLRASAEEATRRKSAFLAQTSHELRTPLNGLLGLLGLLLETDLQPAQKQYAATAFGSAQSMLSLTNDLLDLSRIEAGKLELQTVAFAPRDTLKGAIALFEGTAKAKGLDLVLLVEPAVPDVVRGDSGRLRQIVLNLVGNALKFTERGSVVLRASVQSGDDESTMLRFEVKDTGIGIPAERQAQLFKPFQQIDSWAEFGGSGLGLAVCRELAEMMSGEIGVESAAGLGSTFWFTARFLRSAWVDVPAPTTANGDRIPLAPGKRILVVEDHPVNRLVALRLLEPTGATIELVTTGFEAVSALRRAPYDLVFMDLHMPGMDGFAATAAIRHLEHERGTTATPIVAMTGAATAADRAQCAAAGLDDHVTKPLDRATLYACVQRWLAFPRREAGAVLPPALPAPVTAKPAKRAAAPTPAATLRHALHELANAAQARNGARVRSAAEAIEAAAGQLDAEDVAELVRELQAMDVTRDENWPGICSMVGALQRAADESVTGD